MCNIFPLGSQTWQVLTLKEGDETFWLDRLSKKSKHLVGTSSYLTLIDYVSFVYGLYVFIYVHWDLHKHDLAIKPTSQVSERIRGVFHSFVLKDKEKEQLTRQARGTSCHSHLMRALWPCLRQQETGGCAGVTWCMHVFCRNVVNSKDIYGCPWSKWTVQ